MNKRSVTSMVDTVRANMAIDWLLGIQQSLANCRRAIAETEMNTADSDIDNAMKHIAAAIGKIERI